MERMHEILLGPNLGAQISGPK